MRSTTIGSARRADEAHRDPGDPRAVHQREARRRPHPRCAQAIISTQSALEGTDGLRGRHAERGRRAHRPARRVLGDPRSRELIIDFVIGLLKRQAGILTPADIASSIVGSVSRKRSACPCRAPVKPLPRWATRRLNTRDGVRRRLDHPGFRLEHRAPLHRRVAAPRRRPNAHCARRPRHRTR